MMRSSCYSAFLLRGSQLSRANSSAHAELFSIDVLPVAAIGLRMVAAANLVEVAALVGDTARATMLNALMGGQSLTATELAYCASRKSRLWDRCRTENGSVRSDAHGIPEVL